MKRFVVIASLSVLLLIGVGGCNYMRWLSAPFWPDETKTKMPVQYEGMEGQKVAVVVSADEFLLHRFPTAPAEVGRAIGERMVANLNDIEMMDPGEVTEYLKENPYWDVTPYSKLLEALEVDRIVFVELIEYRTQEPGNAHIWKGMIAGHVNVLSAEAEDQDTPVFRTTIRAEFPEKNEFGVVSSSDEEIRLGMHSLFSRDAAGLFYEYIKTSPRL